MSFKKINYFILWRAICMTGLTLRQLLTQIEDDELYNKSFSNHLQCLIYSLF